MYTLKSPVINELKIIFLLIFKILRKLASKRITLLIDLTGRIALEVVYHVPVDLCMESRQRQLVTVLPNHLNQGLDKPRPIRGVAPAEVSWETWRTFQ